MKGCGGSLLFTSQLIKYGTKGLVVYGKINTVEKNMLRAVPNSNMYRRNL
jgi:hypothetical protein